MHGGRRWDNGRLSGGQRHNHGIRAAGVHGSRTANAHAAGLGAGTLSPEETYDGLGLFRLVYTTFSLVWIRRNRRWSVFTVGFVYRVVSICGCSLVCGQQLPRENNAGEKRERKTGKS